jgi:hypothetical protein
MITFTIQKNGALVEGITLTPPDPADAWGNKNAWKKVIHTI